METPQPNSPSHSSLWEVCSECRDLRQDPGLPGGGLCAPRFMAIAGPFLVMRGLRDWSLGERPAEREVGGPLVPGSWERGKVPREPWLENSGRKEKAPVMAVSEQVG